MLYPEHIEEKIDFTSVRELLKQRCISDLGRERVDALHFSTDYGEVSGWLDETDELLRLLTTDSEELPVGGFYDIRESLRRVRVVGLYLDEAEVHDLRRSLEAVMRLAAYIARHEREQYQHLHDLLVDLEDFPLIVRRIDGMLDKFGRMKDNASPELARIRREVVQVQGGVSRLLAAILRQAQADGYVDKDASPALREGRLVIPVSPAYKRKIGGIVHDESATGKTVYIEPQQVVEANNRVRELENEERREIIRILVAFTDFVRPYSEQIFASQGFLATIDFLRAKALLALELNAIRPRLDPVCHMDWVRAVHPLLYLSLKKQGKDIVPLDIRLDERQRILLISGPNAGGKSVCLKTVVLLQYMLQCGLLVPLHDSSSAGIFERIFIDIGDEQSIENDLSTYSSHLLNMKYFIRHSNARTLLLIDEFGTGTEPQIGGAIAEATLERFNRNGAFGVITTHYTNLKHYAEDAEGIVNGAMLYDRQQLRPLFRLEIGRPGSSFAVEIARKIGLPEDLIAEAAAKVGAEHLDYDKHLQDIVRDKRYWENKRQQIRVKEKRLQEVLDKYETELDEVNRRRKEILSQAKADAQALLTEANARIEGTIRQIREADAEKERTLTARKALEAFKAQVAQSEGGGEAMPVPARLLKKKERKTDRPSRPAAQQPDRPLAAGDHVRLKGQTAVGTVMGIQGRQATVAFGQLKSTVSLNKLERVSNTQMKKETRRYEGLGPAVSDEVRQRKLTFKGDIDVRGMRGDEALQAVTYFIDDAIMVGTAEVRILHGTGNGILRQLIRQYLATVPGVKRFHDEHIQLGGAGITVVELE